jgi:hypothetical protein
MPRVFSERSVYSLQRQVARGSHAQFLYYVAFAAIRASRLVARAYFMSESISVIVKKECLKYLLRLQLLLVSAY